MSIVTAAFNAFTLPPAVVPSREHQNLDRHTRVYVYICGSTALMNLMKGLGATAFYVSASGRRDHLRRIENRRELKHGSILADPDDRHSCCARELPLGYEHFLHPIKEQHLTNVVLPAWCRLRDGVLEIELPIGADTTTFEKAFATALEARNLNGWLDTSDGQKRLQAAGYDPRLRLHTDYRFIGRKARRSIVTEAFLIRPVREMHLIIKAIASIREALVSNLAVNH